MIKTYDKYDLLFIMTLITRMATDIIIFRKGLGEVMAIYHSYV